jgi:hypothetical protein
MTRTPWPKEPTMTGMRFACSFKARYHLPSLESMAELNRWADELGAFVPAVLAELYLEAIAAKLTEAPALSQLVERARTIRDALGLGGVTPQFHVKPAETRRTQVSMGDI